MYDDFDQDADFYNCSLTYCQQQHCDITGLCWNNFFHENWPKLARYILSVLCQHNLCDEEVAKDCLQEATVRFFSNIQKYDPDRELLPYFTRICRNTTYNRLRINRPYIPIHLISENQNGDFYTRDEILQDLALDNAINWIRENFGFNDQQSTIFIYAVVDNLPPREISSLMGIPPDRISKRLYRIYLKIREKLDRDDLLSLL